MIINKFRTYALSGINEITIMEEQKAKTSSALD